ncbi:MAG TPA: sterol desaturase family protein [Tahibacter sp.]|uniref:sterol desaturase family protein n=1 Tax=Tahibacter sp. TaxID=2056211 RepID=UPI002C7A3AAE|nr:sterol desaturase family protein [Tahibacter sp.]HSX62595.1 sterol desaturase family protein [Tahibacter sp.]
MSFPLLFGGAGFAAWSLWSPATAAWLMPVIVAAVGAAVFALERAQPFESRWNGSGDAKEDLGYVASTALFAHIGEVLAWSCALACAAYVAPDVPFWPRNWPMPVQIALALAIGDFLPYLYHRASHESSGVLWRIHAIHHAPAHLNALNFAHFHPLNALLTAGLTLLPLALLGAGADVLFVAGVLHNVHGVLSHANVDFRLGPLNLVFSMAELHRWHHARDPRLANGNYGATVTLWDWLFGTRRTAGRAPAAGEIGLWQGSVVPARLRDRILFPWRDRLPAGCCGG